MFLPESDNESAPSPVKSQPKVPYCKTYEQMRLEEIQAESAAYYSYEAGNDAGLFCNQADIGKAKRIGATRWVNSPKIEEPVKKLDFKVLSLEEIRRRKKERELAAKASTNAPEPSSPIETTRSVKKRSIEQCDEESSVSPAKKRRVSSEFVKSGEPAIKIPPIKLRRSLKSAITKDTQTKSCKDPAGTVDGQGAEISCRERLESHSDESTNANRRSEVEVRLCDSSTDEEKIQTQPEQATDDRKSVATYTTEDIMSSALLAGGRSYANTEDEYLRIDASSDDIMRDIEDLLK